MPLDNTPIILAQIADILREYPQASRGILFGSRALGTARSGSDIDIAIMGDLSYRDILDISLRYDELYIPYRVDFVSYEDIKNPALHEHIDRVGKIIYEADRALNIQH